MAKVIYTDWRDRVNEPEIIGVYEDVEAAYDAIANKEVELKNEGYDTEEEVRVCTEDVNIVRDVVITENEIELVMNALAGKSVVTTTKFVEKIEKILRNYIK